MADSEKRSSYTSFMEGFKEGRAEQDEKKKDDSSLIEDKIIEGFAVGAVESLTNPFRWVKRLLK